MLPAQTWSQITDVTSIILGFKHEVNFYFDFYIIHQWSISILITSFLMSFYYFIFYRWYADVLELPSLQYRCKQYLDGLMHGLMLIRSRGLEEEIIKPFQVWFKFALYIQN